MIPILRKELGDRKFSLFAYCISAAVFLLIYVALFPSLKTDAAQLTKLMQSIPQGYLKAFGAQDIGLNSLESFLAGKQFNLVWPLLAILLVVSSAGNSVAGEIEQGTAGTLLSQPISRTKIYLAKYFAGVSAIVLFIIASILITIPMAIPFHVKTDASGYWLFSLLAFCFALAIYSVSFFVSAISAERSRVYGIIGGILLVMYVLNIVSAIKDNLSFLQYASAFHYLDVDQPLLHHYISWTNVAMFLVVSLISTLLGVYYYNRRDISI